MSEDMSPYCSAHDLADYETLHIMSNTMNHDANDVSIFGGDPVTQLNFAKTF